MLIKKCDIIYKQKGDNDMKKIILMFLALCFMGIALADVDFAAAIKNSSMPTDAEIRRTLAQFNFDAQQQEELFKEIKKKLQQIYSGQNPEQVNAEFNQYYNQVNNEDLNQFMDSSVTQELKRDVSRYPKTK